MKSTTHWLMLYLTAIPLDKINQGSVEALISSIKYTSNEFEARACAMILIMHARYLLNGERDEILKKIL